MSTLSMVVTDHTGAQYLVQVEELVNDSESCVEDETTSYWTAEELRWFRQPLTGGAK